MNSDIVSVINIQRITDQIEKQNSSKESGESQLKYIIKAIGHSVFGIIVFSLLFSTPWTLIPRTNSIIYQDHWMELLFPMATYQLLLIGTNLLNLTIWFKEDVLMSIKNYLKMYCCSVITYSIGYILCYAIWSIYLQYNLRL